MRKHVNAKLCGMAVILALLVGCAGIKTPAAPVTVCNEFPGDSLIEKYFPDLRTANTIIKLSLYEISKLAKVKKETIVKILDEADALADKATYADFAIFAMAKVKFIQENMGPEIAIIGDGLIPFQGVQLPISAKDRCYIKYQIQEDRNKVLPWIRAGIDWDKFMSEIDDVIETSARRATAKTRI